MPALRCVPMLFCLVFSSSVVVADQKTEILPLLRQVANGQIDSHLDTPFVHSKIYGMGFYLAYALAEQCPGAFPSTYETQVKTMANLYFQYRLVYAKRQSDNITEEATKRLFEEPMALNKAIQWVHDPAGSAHDVLEAFGGCGSDDARKLFGNLAAIATFSTLPYPSDFGPMKLVRSEDEDQYSTLCIYDDNLADGIAHGQRVLQFTPANIALMGSMLPVMLDGQTRRRGDTRWEWEFIRPSCPVSPDPAFDLTVIRVDQPIDTTARDGADKAKLAARYYIDTGLPQAAAMNRKPMPPQNFLDELLIEVEKFEAIEITKQEVDASIQEEVNSCVARGSTVDFCTYEGPERVLRVRHDSMIRVKRYVDLHGNRLLEMAMIPHAHTNGIGDYRLSRDLNPYINP